MTNLNSWTEMADKKVRINYNSYLANINNSNFTLKLVLERKPFGTLDVNRRILNKIASVIFI